MSPAFTAILKWLAWRLAVNPTVNAKKLMRVETGNAHPFADLMDCLAEEMPIVQELLISQSAPAQWDWTVILT